MSAVKITRLTDMNIKALEELLTEEQASRVRLGATTATFRMEPAEAVALVAELKEKAAREQGTRFHPVQVAVRGREEAPRGGQGGGFVTEFDVHYVTSNGAAAYCDRPAVRGTRDVTLVTCGGCQGTEAWREEADRIHVAESTPESRDTEPDTIAFLRGIVDQRQFAKRDGLLVDLNTANVILTAYDALTPEYQTKMADLSIQRMAAVAYKVVK